MAGGLHCTQRPGRRGGQRSVLRLSCDSSQARWSTGPEWNMARAGRAIPFDGSREEQMNRKPVGTAFAALVATTTLAAPALAQNEQFIPHLVYRTGAYAPNGIPVANGVADYYRLINERDGGINGVKIAFEECDTGYATDRGVGCYERLKGKGPTGAAYVI